MINRYGKYLYFLIMKKVKKKNLWSFWIIMKLNDKLINKDNNNKKEKYV